MDKMVFLASTAGKEIMRAQAINANNLANASTTGFRQDLAFAESLAVDGPGYATRVYSQSEGIGSDLSPGALVTTGRELDVAIRGQGWFAVQANDGSEAYTRAGDLRLSAAGVLTTGAGLPVIGNSGGPITLPPFEKLEIGVDGTITVRPLGQQAAALAVVDRIKLVNPPTANLRKAEDGLFRLPEGEFAEPDAGVQLVSGVIESSNVNAVDAMVKMMDLSRKFEMQVKMMEQAKSNDSASAKLMQMS
ncbi:MAG TPA: flagellar basal-body rod protein FlgF [Candidatus Tenderia sp.]|nr:flagellar basal-body rod protein FlgF [Candidatus Tenderia sp.]